MLLDERVLPLVCYSTGAGECSRVACGPSRRMKTLSARAGCVNSSDECGNWSACSVARPWKSGLSQGRRRAAVGTDPSARGRAPDLRIPAHHALGEPAAKAEGKPAINAKRVLRIMQVNKLTLERHTGRRPGRTHDDVVIALRSNIRWCSDHFELACRNGELLRVLFAIDACDREVIAWSATTAGIPGEMVRNLMVVCVERRFGTSKTPHLIEWLSDNGSAYIAKDTLDTATALGLQLCFTPVRSPESNGIAEAFVKTFRRDYARL